MRSYDLARRIRAEPKVVNAILLRVNVLREFLGLLYARTDGNNIGAMPSHLADTVSPDEPCKKVYGLVGSVLRAIVIAFAFWLVSLYYSFGGIETSVIGYLVSAFYLVTRQFYLVIAVLQRAVTYREIFLGFVIAQPTGYRHQMYSGLSQLFKDHIDFHEEGHQRLGWLNKVPLLNEWCSEIFSLLKLFSDSIVIRAFRGYLGSLRHNRLLFWTEIGHYLAASLFGLFNVLIGYSLNTIAQDLKILALAFVLIPMVYQFFFMFVTPWFYQAMDKVYIMEEGQPVLQKRRGGPAIASRVLGYRSMLHERLKVAIMQLLAAVCYLVSYQLILYSSNLLTDPSVSGHFPTFLIGLTLIIMTFANIISSLRDAKQNSNNTNIYEQTLRFNPDVPEGVRENYWSIRGASQMVMTCLSLAGMIVGSLLNKIGEC